MECPFCHTPVTVGSLLKSTLHWGDHAYSVNCPNCGAGGFEVDGVIISMLVRTAPTGNQGNGEHVLTTQQGMPETQNIKD